ncbi:hypothetical protein L226DRAFT_514191 [Lentinus tigrinus ALCF2SS1-7]|uniref:uncharacterized protein n=1 Tax=Lentinus tigrinus ALCF2SS1-7 TaxID=1328758 RepID=UPI0011663AF7|nr:hypothetical protein L226DRAFT_514191 [Lentinus tigrinus ALCF2SS1-7]
MATNGPGAQYTFCTTYDAATRAAQVLSASSTIILHCQGRDLGLPDGELSIIALSDPAASEVFLLDVLLLCDKHNPALAPLFSLLERPDITKLVWDGRTYLLEIADTYGVLLQGVIDLQLVEVSTRGKKSEKNLRAQHTMRYFKCVADVLGAASTIPDDIHRLMGLNHCLALFQSGATEKGTYAPAAALHKKHGSAMWLLRPFPDDLQRHCVYNVKLISLIYARFRAKSKYLQHPEELKQMTTRYMEAYPTRELRALHVPLDLDKFLPLEVLTPCPRNTRRYKCVRCERMLIPASFPQHPVSDDDKDERCRLCTLLVLRCSKVKVKPGPVTGVSTAGLSYTLVSTYEQANAAAVALARHPTIILDCEGQDFGSSKGILSILSIGSYPPSDTIYLFDILALRDKHNPFLAPLLSLLRNPNINKLVWDGRSDFLELALTYDITIEGVLDIQLAEVMQRPTYLNTHSLTYFTKSKAVMKDIRNNPRLLDGIHRLLGLDSCAANLRVINALGGKDPAVTNLHRTDGGSMWLHRPLPAMLLDYAAHDIWLISRVADVLLPRVSVEQLREASARYMRVYPTREAKEAHVPLELSKFVPLDVVDAPLPGAPRYYCARCERTLSLSCFGTRQTPTEEAEGDSDTPVNVCSTVLTGPAFQRWTVCHLCVLIACRNLEVQTGPWEWTPLL